MWAALLDRMMALALVSELTSTLLLLNSRPQLWNSPQFLKAWNLVLQTPFRSVVPPANRDQRTQCHDAFKLINFCPTATDLDLKTLVEESVRLDMVDSASVLMPYLGSSSELQT
eukprot:UN14982